MCPKFLSITLTVFLIRTIVSGFNIEDRDPFVKKPASSTNTYFGFSVAEHWETPNSGIKNSWILVGAPLGQNLQPGTNGSGALFKCPITRERDDCEQVKTDGRRVEFDYGELDGNDDNGLVPPGSNEIKNGQWLGVTVKSQKPGGKVIVCAHRYIQSENIAAHRYGLGLCYLIKNTLEVQEDLQPCKGQPMERLHQQFGFCQVGTSLAILDDGFALMGSPGPYTWRGTVFVREVARKFLDRDETPYTGPLNDTPYPIEKYSYLGMSVSGGHLIDKNTMMYVSGAPRSKLFGQVFLLNKIHKNPTLQIYATIEGVQFASSFGYEILVVDVTNDGLDDLLVAAPFYYEAGHGGAVYIYKNFHECLRNCTPDEEVLKGRPESRFGFAMTSLGDINRDGWVDVAIGAPYEDDTGAIYIYLGSKGGFKLSQVIKHQNMGIQTLGYSLSGGLDMDHNGYPDLLVGAYESDMVILYKTRPIIDISIEIRSEELKNINTSRKGCARDPYNNNTVCFSFSSCFRVSNFNSTGALTIRYNIVEVIKTISRISFQSDRHSSSNEKFLNVNNNVEKEYCQDETVYIREGIGDILSPINFMVNFTLNENNVDSPILNETSVKQFEANFQKSCGYDDECQSNLYLEAGTNLKKNNSVYRMELGADEEFIVSVNISNSGEPAYEAKLFVIHPKALSYIALKNDKNRTSNVICSNPNNTLVVCNLGNPFQQNKNESLRLRFEVTDTRVYHLNFTVFVNSTSVELSKHTHQQFTATLVQTPHLTIKGSSSPPTIFYTSDDDTIKGESSMRHLGDIGGRVHHKYQVVNHAKWTILGLAVEILWPYQVFSEMQQGGKWLLYLEDLPKIDNSFENYCTVERFTELVNPLNLSSPKMEAAANNTEAVTFTAVPEQVRSKRESPERITVAEAQTTPLNYNKKRKFSTLECLKHANQGNPTALCARITCVIKELKPNNEVNIEINSRVWNATLGEDYKEVDWVSIKSHAEILLNQLEKNENSSLEAEAETTAYPNMVLPDTNLNWWIIGGAVFAGIVLLILLTYVLYRIGFFERNRFDQTQTGSLQKQGENQNLLNEDNPSDKNVM